MSSEIITLRNSVKHTLFLNFLMLSIILLNSCSDSLQKHTPKVHIVEINEMKFQPAEITVLTGDTVLWINKDMVAHNVTETNAAWASSPIAPGESWKMVVTKSEDYYCSIHVIMKGKLIIGS